MLFENKSVIRNLKSLWIFRLIDRTKFYFIKKKKYLEIIFIIMLIKNFYTRNWCFLLFILQVFQ